MKAATRCEIDRRTCSDRPKDTGPSQSNTKLDECRRGSRTRCSVIAVASRIPSNGAGDCSSRPEIDMMVAAGKNSLGLLRAGDPHGDVATV